MKYKITDPAEEVYRSLSFESVVAEMVGQALSDKLSQKYNTEIKVFYSGGSSFELDIPKSIYIRKEEIYKDLQEAYTESFRKGIEKLALYEGKTQEDIGNVG